MIFYYVLSCLISISIFGWYITWKYDEYLSTLGKEDKSINSYNTICGIIGILFGLDLIIGGIILFGLLSISIHKLVYVLTDFIFWLIFCITTVICLSLGKYFNYKNKHNSIYLRETRLEKIHTQIKEVEKNIEIFENYKKKLQRDNTISSEQKTEGTTIIDSYIKLLKDIYGELNLSLSMTEMNYVTEQFKDIELNDNNFREIQKSIDKMKAYRSLSEVSQEMQDLLKKYDNVSLPKSKEKKNKLNKTT